MVTVGVVAEYNPFHNGHKYQLEQARKMGATHIVCVMSGTAVQRGDIAVFSKYERANAALKNGADLVIELPCPYSCAGAEIFAKSAVSLLGGLGENVVNGISFGCESDDIDMLNKAAEISQKLKDSQEVRQFLSEGMTYPQALKAAAEKTGGKELGVFFDKPNNVLAAEYIKSAKTIAPWIKPMPVKREGTDHDSCEYSGNIASATYVRQLVRSKKSISDFVPYGFEHCTPSFIENADKALLLRYMTASREDVLDLPDCGIDIANRFFAAVNSNPKTTGEFAEIIKSKNITMARVRRLLMHLALGIKKTDFFPVPYGRILGLNNRGREILASAKNRTIPFDTSLKKLENTSANAQRISFLEQNAVRIQDFCKEGILNFTNEYTVKISINSK